MKENLEKQMVEEAAVDLKFTAVAPTEPEPTTEEPNAIFHDETTFSETKTLAIPAVPSAPTALSLRYIFDNLILIAYYFLFGNLLLACGLLSLVIFPGTELFFSTSSNNFYTDLSAKWETGIDTEIDRKIASMPGSWGYWEDN